MPQARTPQSRYVVSTMLFMGAYVVLNVVAITGVLDHLSKATAWVFAMLVALPVAGQIWATLKLIRESDEYFRALLAKRFIVAAGIAMGLFSAWGFAESYAAAPHAPGWLVYPLFWAAFGLVSPILRTTKP